MIIDVDMGNSRIKWRSNDDPVAIHFHGSEREACAKWAALQKVPARVRIASVVDATRVDALVEQVQRELGVQAEVARVRDGLGGVRIGYEDAAALGVDRWLALLAAREWAPQCDLIVASAGTALTIDYLAASGQHLGGYIVPGWQLSTNALLGETARVRFEPPALSESWQPGNSTLNCVEAGLALMYRGIIRTAIEPDLAGFRATTLLLTGGDGLMLGHFVAEELPWAYEPALVLQGLSIALP